MRAYTTLRELIRNCGGKLAEEQFNPDPAGTAQAVFVGRSSARYRLLWDGRQQRGRLQVQVEAAQWQDRGPEVHKPARANFSNLHEFLATAERLAGDAWDDRLKEPGNELPWLRKPPTRH
jgi:hypothetical protein